MAESFVLDLDFSGVVEPCAAEADKEYKLRVIDVRKGTNKNGNDYLMPVFDPYEVVGGKTFSVYLGLPHAGMDAKEKNKTLSDIKIFKEAIGTESNDIADWVGQECWAILGVKNDEQYGEQNFVKKYISNA